ncbi:MAG: hypothetical protein K9I29_04025 [Bacteroidales bacterium]|nr:hypothetical protein [Bacteroidales bacterium]MCF8327441.1 hypothetical protein [Bacteroidales bacterium]
MRKFLFLILCAILPVLNSSGEAIILSDDKPSTPESYFRIKVKTNINQFVIHHQKPWDYTLFISDQGNESSTAYSIIRIPVENLKAKNKLMEKEFFKMLNVRENPYIIIKLPKKQLVRGIQEDAAILNIPSSITFAGATTNSLLSMATRTLDKNTYYISGSEQMELSDFNLDPPQKLGGAIRVKSNVLINFGLSIHYNGDQ